MPSHGTAAEVRAPRSTRIVAENFRLDTFPPFPLDQDAAVHADTAPSDPDPATRRNQAWLSYPCLAAFGVLDGLTHSP